MCDLVIVVGRAWSDSPQAWRTFCRSLPTYALVKVVSSTPELGRLALKQHTRLIRSTLVQFGARYYSSSRKKPARIVFDDLAGKLAWEFTYG